MDEGRSALEEGTAGQQESPVVVQNPTQQQESPGSVPAVTLIVPTSPAKTTDLDSPAAMKTISDRHQQWERLAQNADAKQTEAFNLQWNLIREQMTTFSSETLLIHKELVNIKEEMNKSFEGVRAMGKQSDTSLRLLCNELKVELDIEKQQRKTDISEVDQRIGAVQASLELDKKQQNEFERSLSSLSGDIRRLEERLRAESVMRKESEERLAQDLQSANTNTKSALDDVVKQLEAGLNTLHERLKSEVSDLQADAAARVKQVEEENAKLASEKELERERQARERRAADDALNERLREIISLVDKEKGTRESGESALRSHMGDLKQEIIAQIPMQRILELEKSLEEETKKRSESDNAARASQAKFEAQLEAEGHDRARIVADLTDFLKLQTDSIDAELGVKSAAIAENQSRLQALKELIETESKTRSDMAKETQDTLRSLSDKFSKEIKDRLSGDEEVDRALQQTKQAFQEEVTLRAANDAKVADRLKDINTALEQDRGDREKGQDKLTTLIGEARQEIETEQAQRRDEGAALARSVSALENNLSARVKEVGAALDGEIKTRAEEFKAIRGECSRLEAKGDGVANELARTSRDLVDQISKLSESLTNETSNRMNGDAELQILAKELQTAIDQESALRCKSFAEVGEQIKEETKERTTSVIASDESSTRNLNEAVLRLEKIIYSLRDALWQKMLNVSHLMTLQHKEWQGAPPTIDFSDGVPAGKMLDFDSPALDNGVQAKEKS